MKASILLHLFLQVVLLFDALGWKVKMPKDIHGLKGSCLVIPCSFNYTSDPPKNPRRVVWYQWASKGYPLVFDPLNANSVIEKFKGNTDLYGTSDWDCSLLIRNLEQSHHKENVYTWIDPGNVKYRFYDITSKIHVDAHPKLPNISISGGQRMGEMITVTCSTSHTCPYSKPNITLKGFKGSDQINHEFINDGLWKIILTRIGVVKTENLTIECLVTHHGGINATATEVKSAKCVHQQIKIEPELADLTEGVAMIFTCSVYHSCQRETPNITWNYENMQVSTESKALSGLERVTYSNITFLGAIEDNKKTLNCTAKLSRGGVTVSVVLYVKCLYQVKIEPELADLTEGVAQIFTCSVHHSCQRETPTITWNYENMEVSEGTRTLSGSYGVIYSNITFLGTAEDHGKKLSCTAKLSGGNNTTSVSLSVQSDSKPFGLKTIGLYILTPLLAFLIACLFCGLIICKKHQSSKDSTVTGNKPLSNPPMPLPRSDPTSFSDCEAEYVNMEEINIYENI